MDTVGCSRGLEDLQLCDIRMPSLLFWNHALLASLERSLDWKTPRSADPFFSSSSLLLTLNLVPDKL